MSIARLAVGTEVVPGRRKEDKVACEAAAVRRPFRALQGRGTFVWGPEMDTDPVLDLGSGWPWCRASGRLLADNLSN